MILKLAQMSVAKSRPSVAYGANLFVNVVITCIGCCVVSYKLWSCVAASPNVKQYEKVKNVIEDDPFQVECIAWGTLPLTMTWTRDGAPVTADEQRIMYKNGTGSGQVLANSTLRINSMKYDDQGNYVCVVENEYGNSSATITVHVKGTLLSLLTRIDGSVRITFLVHPVRCDAKSGNHVVYVVWLVENRFGADFARDIEGLAGVTRPTKNRWNERYSTLGNVWLC